MHPLVFQEEKNLSIEYPSHNVCQYSVYPIDTRSKIPCPSPLPRRRQWHPTPVLLPGKSHGWRAWWATVHGITKSRTWLSDFTFTFHFHALEKEMATHSSVLAWRIPGMGEPCGLPSMGLHRVRYDWSDLAAAVLSLDSSCSSICF